MRRIAGFGATIILVGLAACASRARPGAPTPQGGIKWSSLTALLDSAITAKAAPGAVVAVSFNGLRFIYGTGHLGEGFPARPDAETVYDLASLTKVIGLTTMAMIAVDEGRLGLDTPVQYYLPEFIGPYKDRVTVRHLLTHSSGLRAHRPLWRETPDRGWALALAAATQLDTIPATRMVYSDIGAILLTRILERQYGDRIDHLLTQRVFAPLGMRSTTYRPPAEWSDRIAPTELDPWRGRMIHGEVHDENAAHLGGVSGHAGLFSDAVDLLAFGEWILRRFVASRAPNGGGDRGPALRATTVQEFTRRQHVVPESSRALGWDTPSDGSSAGTRLSARSFGHTGFTGTSIWADPTQGLVIVLLTNRVHPTRDNPRVGPLRIAVADRVVELLSAPTP